VERRRWYPVSDKFRICIQKSFCVEVAKAFGRGLCGFYDADEWENIVKRYGPLKHLQTLGRTP